MIKSSYRLDRAHFNVLFNSFEILELLIMDNRDLKQEEAVKKTRRPTAKFPFKWNRSWLNFNSLASASC